LEIGRFIVSQASGLKIDEALSYRFALHATALAASEAPELGHYGCSTLRVDAFPGFHDISWIEHGGLEV
jgi:hypothetical protein